MSVCWWRRGGGGVQDTVSGEAVSKDGKHIVRYKFKLKQGRRKINRTFMANTCAATGRVWCVRVRRVYI